MEFAREQVANNPKKPRESPLFTWQFSTPEEQGMDSVKLLEMLEYYEKQNAKDEKVLIDVITIVRNGYIVADIYLNPLFPKNTLHVINSCTKSIVSALIGIAIDRGYIESVGIKVIDTLKDKAPENTDEWLKLLTLEDLLTMQTGLNTQDSYLYKWRRLLEMQKTDDWVKYILSLPTVIEPGQRFDYSNMSSFLLSAIITQATGMDTLSFAKKYLFDPLGIVDVKWERSPQGIYNGFARIWLKPHDMAKIGQLYLQQGTWNAQQILPAQWVKDSTQTHSRPKKYRPILDEHGKVEYIKSALVWIFTNLLRPFSDGYGYQWWLDKSGMYSAVGVGGQYIMVVPDEHLVVVFASKLSGKGVFLPATMLKKFILPAIVSNNEIPTNMTTQNKLATVSEPPALSNKPKAVQELPSIALKISGKTYSLESNAWNYDNFQLTFERNQEFALFNYTTRKNIRVSYEIGLNNVYRMTDSNNDTYAVMGSWTSPNTFVIDYELVGYSSRGKWKLTFEKDVILVQEHGVTGQYTYRGKMR